MDKPILYTVSEGTYSAILVSFLQESVGHMIPWLIVAAAVILCDLVTGIRKSLLMGEVVRFSSACRRTMGKTVEYFLFVVTMVVIDVAAHGGGTIDKWACLGVCCVEGVSIVGNIVRPKGYKINFVKLIAVVFGKKFDVEKKDIEDVIEKEKP